MALTFSILSVTYVKASAKYDGNGKRWVHRDPPLGKVKVIYGNIMKEIIGHLRRWPITDLDKLLSGHGNNKVL